MRAEWAINADGARYVEAARWELELTCSSSGGDVKAQNGLFVLKSHGNSPKNRKRTDGAAWFSQSLQQRQV